MWRTPTAARRPSGARRHDGGATRRRDTPTACRGDAGAAPAIAGSRSCTVRRPVRRPRSATGGSGPAVAYAAPACSASPGRRRTAISSTTRSRPPATLQLTADKTVVSGAAQGLNTPRLARVGTDFVLAYGADDGSGAQAAVVRVAPATGVADRTGRAGDERPGVAASPEIGGIAVSGDQKNDRRGQPAAGTRRARPRRSSTSSATRSTFVTARMPSQLGATRTTGIGWAPDRFIAGAVTAGDQRGRNIAGTVRHEPDGGREVPVHGGGASPVVGSGGATMSVAGASDRVAVAWVDLQTGTREVCIAVVSLQHRTARRRPSRRASEHDDQVAYPHVVFDGAAFALAWLEGSGTERYRRSSSPASTPTWRRWATAHDRRQRRRASASATSTSPPPGPNVYGIAAAGATSTQQLFNVTCN